VLDANSPLAILNLSDNQLHAEAGRALGRALRSSRALALLNLRLNRLGDAGCGALLEALAGGGGGTGGSPEDAGDGGGAGSGAGSGPGSGPGGGGGGSGCALEALSIAANGAGPEATGALVAALRRAPRLARVDASGNGLGPAAGPELVAAVKEGAALAAVDLRGCGLRPEDEAEVADELLCRADRRGLTGGGGCGAVGSAPGQAVGGEA
jgi:hypothetical protein